MFLILTLTPRLTRAPDPIMSHHELKIPIQTADFYFEIHHHIQCVVGVHRNSIFVTLESLKSSIKITILENFKSSARRCKQLADRVI